MFSDAEAGRKHGYFDGWGDDGCFHYTGEGQFGDQEMAQGNAAILRHEQEGRALRVFDGVRGTVTYVDEFAVDSQDPFYRTDAPESGGEKIREVIVFRLRPLTIAAQSPDLPARDIPPGVSQVPVEAQWTEATFVNPKSVPYTATRREQKLVVAFQAYLEGRDRTVVRHAIVPEGEAKPLLTDLHEIERNNLIEAKGTTERGAIRMAIGQLADYARFIDPTPHKAVLLPRLPRADVSALLRAEGIAVIVPSEGTGFEDDADGAFT